MNQQYKAAKNRPLTEEEKVNIQKILNDPNSDPDDVSDLRMHLCCLALDDLFAEEMDDEKES